jgi:hypothetical protein
MSITQEELDEMLKRNTDLRIDEWKPASKRQADILANHTPMVLYGTPAKRNKYNVSAKEDRTYNGITYDSKKEMNFYINILIPMLEKGEIDYVLYHVPFIVGNDPKTTYEADFVVLGNICNVGEDAWHIKVIEVKGMNTASGKRKIKLFKAKYPNLTLEII